MGNIEKMVQNSSETRKTVERRKERKKERKKVSVVRNAMWLHYDIGTIDSELLASSGTETGVDCQSLCWEASDG